MRRILHVNKFLYRRGGAEAYMQDVAGLQAEAGNEIAFFGMAHAENDALPYATSFPSQVDFDPAPPSLVGKAQGIGRMLWSTSASRGMAEVIDSFRPDVVHFHNIYHQLSPSILGPAKRRGVPMVMTLHDYALACPTHNFMSHGEICESCIGGHFSQAIKKRCQGGSLAASSVGALELTLHTRLDAYGSIDLLVCPSQFMADKMTQAGVHPEKLRRLKHFVHAAQPAKTEPGTDVLFIGRLSHEKGIDLLIRAMADVPAPTVLNILGDGPDRDRLEALAHEVAPDQIFFHGRQPAEAVSTWLRSATVSVVPSRWYENQPLAVLESYCAGTPVIGTDLGGITELIESGVTGELFANGSISELSEKIRRMVADPAGSQKMGAAGRAWAEEQLAPDVHLAGLDAIYDEAAGMSRRSAVPVSS